jgi:Lamin Tail Domain/Secretion system C-terminal sorting domain
MKKFFTLLMIVLSVSFASYGQIVLTEISYNPPESGTDSLEYIEILNAGTTNVNLKDYKFTKGVDFTFPDTVLNSGKYYLVVKHARAFRLVYGIEASEWSPLNPLSTTNTLSNSGEIIELADVAGNVLLSFKYDKLVPWPTFADGTDGAGGSIELCDLAADPSKGESWKVSQNDLGFVLNGKQVLGTPGFVNSITDCTGDPVDPFPLRSIASVTTVNAEGATDSIDVSCTLKGVVYGVNLRPTGLQFTIIDNQNNGIGAFVNAGNFNYAVKEGDEVEIKGTIDQFNGFTQMTLADVKKVSENNTLVQPKIVTEFLEEDESSLVTLGYVTFQDPSQWTGMNSGFNVTMIDGNNQQFTVRIDNDVDAYAAPFPGVNTYFVTGLLGQFDSESPFNEGYQLLPRYLVDFDPAGSTQNVLDANMTLSPNPVNNIVTIKTNAQPESIVIYNAQGQQLSVIQNALEVDMSAFVAGVYFIKAVKADKSSTVRIIKM